MQCALHIVPLKYLIVMPDIKEGKFLNLQFFCLPLGAARVGQKKFAASRIWPPLNLFLFTPLIMMYRGPQKIMEYKDDFKRNSNLFHCKK